MLCGFIIFAYKLTELCLVELKSNYYLFHL